MKTEKWFGFDVRFKEIDGEWYAACTDICRALEIEDADTIMNDAGNIYISFDNEEAVELAMNEFCVYKALFLSKKLEASQFRIWSGTVMKKLRELAGLEGYEALRMTEVDVQNRINDILDTMFYDPQTDQIMISITVAGGDVEPIPLYSD